MPLQPARLIPTLTRIKRLVVKPLTTKSISCVLVCLFVAVSHLTSPAIGQDNAGGVVAVVNADPITRKALSDASLERYGVDVLDNMVNRYLIQQACEKSGIEVTNDEVHGEIQRLASKFGLNVQSYMQLLEEERDISPAQYSREVVWPMLALRKLVAGQVEPTQEEFDQAYLAQFGEAIKCRMIMVPGQETAESLRAQAAANPDQFGAIAKKYSKDETSASVGGLIPPIRRYTGDPALENAVFALQDNEISPALQMGDQWIVLQAVRRIPASTPPPTALPAIKEQIKDRIRDQKMRGAASRLFAQLQKDAKVTKVLGDDKLKAQYPGVAAVVNGQQVTLAAVGAECVKRHGVDVLEGEINRKLLTQALRKANLQVTSDDIVGEISRAAKSMGIVKADGSADLETWMSNVASEGNTTQEIYETDSVWPSVALKKLVEQSVQISEDDLKRGYQSSFGPRAEVLAIVLADQRTAQKVWEMARDNGSDEFFGQLAEQYSIEPASASNRGKVPPIRKFGGQPSIEREAFGLKPGDLSGIVATGDKYIIMRCQGFTKPIVKDMAAVKSELTRDLQEKKMSVAMAEKFDQLKRSAEIDNFLEARKKLHAAETPRVRQTSAEAPVRRQ